MTGLSLALAACAGQVAPPRSITTHPVKLSAPADAVAAGVRAGPSIASLPLTPQVASAALAAFRTSCRELLRRADVSGLTRNADWQPACDAAAATLPTPDPAGFFARYFETATIGDGKAFATGYYEPEIAGSRTALPGYAPIYRNPGDIVEVDLGLFAGDLKGRRLRGRVAAGKLVPYFERSEIEAGALAGRGLELAWAADPIELFFLQIQGSGRLRMADGCVMRIGYDGQNGRDYVGIGRLMRDRGLIGPDQLSMQGMMAWLRANPGQAKAIMDENKSYVFFRELSGEGPIGALGLPVAGRVSAAADPAFVPLGAPVWLALDRPEASGLWIAQDTGGAITGANRFDTFWGAGDEARRIAGGMSGRGTAYILVPVGTVARLAHAAPPRP